MSFQKRLREILAQAVALLEPTANGQPIDRAMAEWHIRDQLWSLIPWEDWLLDLYTDTGGTRFALVLDNEARLIQVPFEVVNDQVVLGERVPVMQVFMPVQQAAPSVRLRVAEVNGKRRWYAIAATSVLNRVGEIDSRTLFDDFVQHFNAGEFDEPYLTFYHEDEKLRLGSIDTVARFEYSLFLSGEFDEGVLAQAAADAIERDADTDNPWGMSIGFMPLEAPDILDIGSGISFPVYTRGYLVESSMLRERHAANWFTQMRNMEVHRVANEIARDELAGILKGKADDATIDALLARVNGVNRHIEEAGLITRDAAQIEAATETVAQDVEVEMDETTINSLAGALVGNPSFQTLVQEAVADAAATAVGEAIVPVNQALDTIRKRLSDVDADVEALLGEAQEREADAPSTAKRRYNLTMRPRERHAETDDSDESDLGFDDVADDALSRIASKP